MQQQIKPVDDLIKEGFAQRIKKQFRAPAIFVSSPDKLKLLQQLQGNVPVEYPYIFLLVQAVNAAPERYNTNRLSRQGVRVQLNTEGNQYSMARVIPINFDIEVTFVTNKYSGVDTNSVDGFARRWMFARRNGSLNFMVNYGMTNFPVTYTVAESLQIPVRENPADQESVYPVVGNISLQGYISEPVLGTRGRISQIVLSEAVPTLGAAGEKFFPFP